MPEVVIRPCATDDAEEVERLRVSGWLAAYRGIVPDAFLDSMSVNAERRRKFIAERPPTVTEAVAVHEGAIAGWIVAGPCRDDDRTKPWHGEIYACYVLPRWWGRGIGGKLFTHATQALDEAGLTDIILWVLQENHRARGFYESHGFSPDGTRRVLDLAGPVWEVRYWRPPPAPPPG